MLLKPYKTQDDSPKPRTQMSTLPAGESPVCVTATGKELELRLHPQGTHANPQAPITTVMEAFVLFL
jgi:hypothetical protein